MTSLTCLIFCFSTVKGDEIGPRSEYVEDQPFAEQPEAVPQDQTPKSVGKAAQDGSTAAKGSGVGKYVLAAAVIAVGITALIVVHKN